jgi:hypothetical protein
MSPIWAGVTGLFLGKATSHKSYLVPVDSAVGVALDLKYSFDAENRTACKLHNKVPCLSLLK